MPGCYSASKIYPIFCAVGGDANLHSDLHFDTFAQLEQTVSTWPDKEAPNNAGDRGGIFDDGWIKTF